MAVYDITANAATAVSAFLTAFTLNANGDIRYSAGADTFHTWWIHRALQSKVYDFTTSGDDLLNLAKPNPSTSEALGTIITLQDHTAAYAVNYNVTATEIEYLFGGSIEQNNGDDRWSGMQVLGSVNNPATELQIISDDSLLTSHWGTGKNQTDGNTLLRVMIQTISGGSAIDGGRVIVKANEWGDTYAVWRTTLGLGEGVASIVTGSDPQNDTALVTVQGYTGITTTEGYQTIDVGTGGLKPYLTGWDYGANDKKALYEWRKSQLVRGTAVNVFGMDGDLFTGGPTFKADVSGAGSELFVQNELLSWTESGVPSTGTLMGADSLTDGSTTEIWVHIRTGINPTNGTVVTGAAGSVTLTADGTNLIPAANGIGQFTGAWIADYGVGFDAAQVGQADSLRPLDDSGPLSPPNNVLVSVQANGVANAHVFLARATGGNINQTQYTAAAGNTSGNSTFVIKESFAADDPITGWLLVIEGGAFVPLEVTSWAGSTAQINGTLPQTFTEDAVVLFAYLYDNIASDGGTAQTSLVQSSNIEVAGWVRFGDAAAPRKPVPISGTIGPAGLSLSVTLETE